MTSEDLFEFALAWLAFLLTVGAVDGVAFFILYRLGFRFGDLPELATRAWRVAASYVLGACRNDDEER